LDRRLGRHQNRFGCHRDNKNFSFCCSFDNYLPKGKSIHISFIKEQDETWRRLAVAAAQNSSNFS